MALSGSNTQSKFCDLGELYRYVVLFWKFGAIDMKDG